MSEVTDRIPEGTVTVLISDVQSSTDLRTSLGDEAAQDILRAHEELVNREVERHGGRRIKGLGDGTLAAFTSARRAVRAAAGIQHALKQRAMNDPDHTLPVKIGLNTGEVTEEGGDIFGEAVNAASRITAEANGGQILISELTRMLAGTMPDVRLTDAGSVELKGFKEPWQLHLVEWELETSPERQERLFVGRGEERARLSSILDKAKAGNGSLVFLGGDPGVGKTRLAEELAAEAAAKEMLTLRGRCYEMEGAVPYLPFVELLEMARRNVEPEVLREALGPEAGEVARIVPELRRTYPDIPEPLDLPAEQERRYLFNSVRDFVARAASITPLFITLDDVHWADEPSVLLMEHIAEKVKELPVFIIATYRHTDLDVSRPLAEALSRATQRRLAERVILKPLADHEVEALISAMSSQELPPGLSKAIFEATDGNPFFVEEVFKHLSEEGNLFQQDGRFRGDFDLDRLEVPEGVRLVVGRRLSRLGEQGTKALSVAAVIGRGFSYELLKEVGESDEDTLLNAIDDAERANLIVSEAAGRDIEYRFAHELIRIALIDQISLPRRQRTHVRIADAIERLWPTEIDDHFGDIAYHLFQAGAAADPDRTVSYLIKAGERAMDAAAYEDALRHFDNALPIAEDLQLKAKAHYGRGAAKRSMFLIQEAMDEWRQALSIYEDLGNNEEIGHMCFDIAYELAWGAKWPESLEMCTRGLAAIGDKRDLERAILEGLAGLVLSLAGQYHEGLARIDEAQAISQEPEAQSQVDTERGTSLGRVQGLALAARSLHHWGYLEFKEAVEFGEQAVTLLEEGNALWDMTSMLGFLGQAHLFMGNIERWGEIAERTSELADRLGHIGAIMVNADGRAYTQDVAPEEFLHTFERFCLDRVKLADEHGWGVNQAGFMRIFAGTARYWKGDLEGAVALATEAGSQELPGVFAGQGDGFVVMFKGYDGDRQGVVEGYEALKQRIPPLGEPMPIAEASTVSTCFEGLVMVGENERALELVPHIQAIYDRGIRYRVVDLATLAIQTGMGAALKGDWEAMEASFAAAAADAQANRFWPLGRYEVKRFHAQALLLRGREEDEQRAKDLLAAAAEGYREFQMPLHTELTTKLIEGKAERSSS